MLTLTINLRKDLKAVGKHLKERTSDYAIYENLGPGQDDDPISLITLGFEFDQDCWFSLVFDTRPNAAPDGEWNMHAVDNLVEMPHWFDRPGKIILHDGTVSKIAPEYEELAVSKFFGEMLRSALREARDIGLFSKLPTTKDCILCVEHSDGSYGAIDYLDGRHTQKTEEELQTELYDQIQKLSHDDQIRYWISELNKLCMGKPSELAENFLFPDDIIFDAIELLGDTAVLPLLQLCFRHSTKSEFDADRPKRNIDETPFGRMGWQIIRSVEKIGSTDPAVQKQLKRIIKRACDANAERKLWGLVPWHAARVLHMLFDDPPPKTNDRTNALINVQDYA